MVRTLVRYAVRRWVVLAAISSFIAILAGRKSVAKAISARRSQEDVFGTPLPVTPEPHRKPRPRPTGSGRLGADAVASAKVNTKAAEEQLAAAFREQGIAALVALENSGQLPVVVVRDAQIAEALDKSSDDITSRVTHTIESLRSSAIAAGTGDLEGTPWRVIQAFGVPGSGEWSALVRVGDQSVIVRVVDSGQFRATERHAQERSSSRRRSHGRGDIGHGLERHLKR